MHVKRFSHLTEFRDGKHNEILTLLLAPKQSTNRHAATLCAAVKKQHSNTKKACSLAQFIETLLVGSQFT